MTRRRMRAAAVHKKTPNSGKQPQNRNNVQKTKADKDDHARMGFALIPPITSTGLYTSPGAAAPATTCMYRGVTKQGITQTNSSETGSNAAFILSLNKRVRYKCARQVRNKRPNIMEARPFLWGKITIMSSRTDAVFVG